MPEGIPQADDFKFETDELRPLTEGDIELRPIFISVDPYLRVAMAGGHPPAINVTPNSTLSLSQIEPRPALLFESQRT